MSTSEKQIGISKDDLLEILKEVKKPVKTEAQIKAEQQAKQDAEALGETLRLKAANDKANQEACTHMRFNGTTCAVYIHNGNYMLCQHCHKVIRPAEEPALFNRLIQLSNYTDF
jgi:hypothetical protein